MIQKTIDTNKVILNLSYETLVITLNLVSLNLKTLSCPENWLKLTSFACLYTLNVHYKCHFWREYISEFIYEWEGEGGKREGRRSEERLHIGLVF